MQEIDDIDDGDGKFPPSLKSTGRVVQGAIKEALELVRERKVSGISAAAVRCGVSREQLLEHARREGLCDEVGTLTRRA